MLTYKQRWRESLGINRGERWALDRGGVLLGDDRHPKLPRFDFRRHYFTTDKIAYGTYTAMTVTNLQSLAIDTSDPYAGWQSARVDNQTATLADDYEIIIDLSTAATAPANDQAIYVYLVPWMTTDGGTTWISGGNFGTTTLPTGTEGTASMSDPNSMKGPFVMPYKVTSQRIEGWFTVGAMCGGIVPCGWSLALRNNCGAALGTGCVVSYRSITYTNG